MATAETLEVIRTEFIEKVGLIAQSDGLPRAAGRLLGLLIFEGDKFSFSILAERLQVSRGTVSSATRMLEDRALIKRVTRPGDRQDYFELSEAPYINMLRTVRTGIRRAREDIGATLDKLPDDQAGIRSRVEEFAALYDALGDAADQAVANMIRRRV